MSVTTKIRTRESCFKSWLRKQVLDEGMTYKEVGEILGVTKQRVKCYCSKFGITLDQRTARWYARRKGIPELEKTDWLLKRQAKNSNYNLTILANELKVNRDWLIRQIKRLGLNSADFRYKVIIITKPCAFCGKLVTRPADMKTRSYKNFFCNRSHFVKWLWRDKKWRQNGNRRLWTPEEKQFLQGNWLKMSDEQIARQLGRTIRSIESMRRKLNLLVK